MKYLSASIILYCAFAILSTLAQQHSLYSGNCIYDNNTVPIYTQLIVLRNPRPGNVYKSPTPPPARRWYDVFSRFSFRRRPTVHQLHNSGPIINATIVFPPNGTANHFRIKCIQVIDNLHNNTGGYATIVAGGVNHNSTTILLKSQPGGDLNNKIVIFTYKENGVHPVQPIQQRPPSYGWAPPQQQQQQQQPRPHYPWSSSSNHIPGRSPYWSP